MIMTTAGNVWVRVGIASNCRATEPNAFQRYRTRNKRALPVDALQILEAAFAMRARAFCASPNERGSARNTTFGFLMGG